MYKASDFGQPTSSAPKTSDFQAAPAAQPQQAPQFKASDFGSAQPSQQAEAPLRLPAHLQPNIQTAIDQVAQQKGLPVWALRAMARLESGGTPRPEVAASPAGAQGVMQLMPDTFRSIMPHGNILNMHDNIVAGATYYQQLLKKYGDPVKAAGAYNVGPGAFDDYLAGKRGLPAETRNYMAQVAAMHTPENETPLPPLPAPQTHAQRTPNQTHSNLNAQAAKHEWYDQLFGHQDIPFILDNAVLLDRIMPGQGHLQKALHLYAKDPAAAADMYGDNSKYVLEAMAEIPETSDPFLSFRRSNARAMLAHPWLAAGETAIEEFFNPMSAVEGRGLGGILGRGAKLLNQTYAGRMALHSASPYREVVARHGENARNLLHQMGALINGSEKQARSSTAKVFEGLTNAEQWEVVRLKQGLTPNPAHAGNASLPTRAQALHASIANMTQAKLANGTIRPTQAYDIQKYFPMRGAFENPIYDEDTMSFLDQLRPGMARRAPTQESVHQRKFDTFDDAVAAGRVDPTKVNAASQFYRYMRAGQQNIEFEKGLKRIAARYPDMIRIVPGTGRFVHGTPPVDQWGRQMIHLPDRLGRIASPTLSHAWVSREFADWFSRGKAPGALTGWSDAEALNQTMNIVHKLNSAQRNFIITNPGFHPFWNIAPNASAAERASLPGVMRNYGRALVGTAFSVGDFAKHIPGVGPIAGKGLDALEKRFWVGSQQYAHDLADAIAAGAEAHFGSKTSALGGDAARIRTLASGDLTNMEKLDKFLTAIGDWNSHATFGERGEGQFVATLYKNRIARGLAPEDAAWEVRQALGHYLNVDPNSWQMKYIMFYPWLKSNVPHWMMQFFVNPAIPHAQVEAFHRHNEMAGDPRIADALHRRNPAQLYLGKDARGRDVTWTPPFPWKDAEKVGEVVAPGPDSLQDRLQTAEGLLSSRLKVVPSEVVNTLGTLWGQPAERGTFQGFTTMYNKDAPAIQQLQEEAVSLIEKSGLYPSPFLVQDLIAQGYDETRMTDYVTELVGGGVINRTQGREQAKLLKKLGLKYKAQVIKLYKHQTGTNPWTQDEFNARLKALHDRYEAHVKRVQDALTRKAQPAPTYKTSDFGGTPTYRAEDFGR